MNTLSLVIKIFTLITVMTLKAREVGNKMAIDTTFPCQSTIFKLLPFESTKGRIPYVTSTD